MDEATFQALIAYLESQGIDPTPLLLSGGDVGDAEDIFGLQNTALLVNDKQRDAMADLFGPRALLGPGAYNPAAFEPTVEYLPMPRTQRVARFAADQSLVPTTIDDFVAQAIAQDKDWGAAAAAMTNLINSDPSLLSPADAQIRQSLIAQVEPVFDEATGAYRADTPNLRSLVQRAQTVYDDYVKEQASAEGYTTTPDGMAYKETQSPAAQEYLERGLHLPTERYSQQFFMDQVQPGWQDPRPELDALLAKARELGVANRSQALARNAARTQQTASRPAQSAGAPDYDAMNREAAQRMLGNIQDEMGMTPQNTRTYSAGGAGRTYHPPVSESDWSKAGTAYQEARQRELNPAFWQNTAMGFLLDRAGRNPLMDQIAGMQGIDMGMPSITPDDRDEWAKVVDSYTRDSERQSRAMRGNKKVGDTAFGKSVLAKLLSNPNRGG